MKIPAIIAAPLIAALFGLEAWTLTKVIDLGEQMAALKVEVRLLARTQSANLTGRTHNE